MDVDQVTIKIVDAPYPIEMQIVRNGFTEVKYTTPSDLKAVFAGVESTQSIFFPPDLIASNLSSFAAFYRPPQVTNILLAGENHKEQKSIQIPTPGLIMVLRGKRGKNSGLSIVAVKGKERPSDPTVPLYNPPFPNVSNQSGSVCMGNSLCIPFGFDSRAGWISFWGSAFGNHSTAGKSQKYPNDIRLFLLELINQPEYPEDDLVPANVNLSDYLAIDLKR